MFADNTLIIVNAVCIVFLITITAIMAAATRMKGGAGWAALIAVSSSLPAIFTNMTIMIDDLAGGFRVMCYVVSANALCFPGLYLFVRSQFEKNFRLTPVIYLHFLPAVVSTVIYLICYIPMTAGQVEAVRLLVKSGKEDLPLIINDIILYGQYLIYTVVCFWYIRRRKKYLKDNFADSGYFSTRWVTRFMEAVTLLFMGVLVSYLISPTSLVWTISLLLAIGIGFLAYIVIFHSTAAYINRLPDTPEDTASPHKINGEKTVISNEQMQEICHTVTQYLQTSEAYKNSDLTLTAVSHETGISPRNISAAINAYLHRNFFELVNAMRAEEAKRLLLELRTDNYTIDSIYSKCGFSSRSTFFAVFKKMEGKTPSQWLKMEM